MSAALPGDPQPHRGRTGARLVAGAVSVGLHLLLVIFFMVGRPPPASVEPPPPEVAALVMMDPPKPAPQPTAESEPAPGPPEAEPPSAAAAAPTPAPPHAAKPPVRPPEVKPLPAPVSPKSRTPTPTAPVVQAAFPTVGDSQLAGAAIAGSGAGGGGGEGDGGSCDMVRRVQTALRRNAQVRAAIIAAHQSSPPTGALLVWNGDWVRDPGQDGKGLAGVRQAIALEVAFAPGPCRTQAMRGLVLISMEDRPGGARLALGGGAWRWSDLLGAEAGQQRRIGG